MLIFNQRMVPGDKILQGSFSLDGQKWNEAVAEKQGKHPSDY
jgi:hypothetical protein